MEGNRDIIHHEAGRYSTLNQQNFINTQSLQVKTNPNRAKTPLNIFTNKGINKNSNCAEINSDENHNFMMIGMSSPLTDGKGMKQRRKSGLKLN